MAVMTTALRAEIFPADLDATVDFYSRVLSFEVTLDQRETHGYVALARDGVRLGAAARTPPSGLDVARRPPIGVELVLEVDDVERERERVRGAGWPLDEELTARPWGLTDFRVVDPDGYYLRITDRP